MVVLLAVRLFVRIERPAALSADRPVMIFYGYDPARKGGDQGCKVTFERQSDGVLVITDIEWIDWTPPHPPQSDGGTDHG